MSAEDLAGLGAVGAANDIETPARKRLALLFDEGRYSELGGTGEKGTSKSVITAFGMIEGAPAYAFSQDVTIDSGAVGRLQAQKICKLFELAVKTGAPIVGIYDSNGAKAEEGTDVLDAYGQIMRSVGRASGVVPQIAVVAGVCAGSMAMIAAGADMLIMSEEGSLFMTPPFVAGDRDGADAKAAAKAGIAQIVVKDDEGAFTAARELLSLLPANNISGLPAFEYDLPEGTGEKGAFGTLLSAADANSVTELGEGFGGSARCGFATLCGTPFGFASVDGELTADGCAKLARHISLCDCFSVPVVTFIDSEGFASSVNGIVRDAAKLAYAYSSTTTVKLAVVTGSAYGAIYSALAGSAANSDMVFVLRGGSIGALRPQTAVELMYADRISESRSRADVEREYASVEAGAEAAVANGAADRVIAPEETRTVLAEALDMLAGKRADPAPRKHADLPM